MKLPKSRLRAGYAGITASVVDDRDQSQLILAEAKVAPAAPTAAGETTSRGRCLSLASLLRNAMLVIGGTSALMALLYGSALLGDWLCSVLF